MKILLIGQNGQVGRQLQQALKSLGQLQAHGRDTLDLAYPEHIHPILMASKPDIIVNAAAYTAVDQAEREPDLVSLINSRAVSVLAAAAVKLDALLVHYSTDYVFDGSLNRPYREEDQTAPLNVYGRSKLAAEENIQHSGVNGIIFRSSWIYGERGRNFPATILNHARTSASLKVVTDGIGAPTDAKLIAGITALMLQRHIAAVRQKGVSVYHLAAEGETNWFEYARFIIKCAQDQGAPLALTEADILPILQQDLESPARRPKNSRLDTSKLRRALGIGLPHWKLGVARFVRNLCIGRTL